MGSGILNIGVTGLNAAQAGVLTTSHNIANASTKGFSRQQIVQTTNAPMFTGAGFIGQGTNVETIQRVYDKFLSGQVLSAQTGAAEMDSYLAEIKQIDHLLADPDAGLSPAMADFFKGVQDVAANPQSISARQAMLSSSQALVGRFQSIDQRLREIRDGINGQITGEVSLINSYAQQIASVNQRIIAAEASGPGQPANDLLDQRDQLIADLNKEIRVTTLQQSDGSYSVFIGNGQALVAGTLSYSMQAAAAPADPERTIVALRSPNGSTVNMPESLLSGGKLGGLIAFRSESLDLAQNSLGRIAIGLAQNFNDIHRLGQNLSGGLGGAFFNVPTPVVNAGSANASQATLLSAQIINSDYRISYNGGTSTYDVVRLSDNSAAGAFAAAAFPITVDGVKISLASGAAVAGDTFLVRPASSVGSRVIAESDNTGTAVLDSAGSNIQALTTSDYQLAVTAVDAVPNYTFALTRLSDRQTWTGSGTGATAALAAQAALADLATKQQVGFQLGFSGTVPSLNDSFVIQPTRGGAGNISVAVTDPSGIAAALPMRTAAASGNTGTAAIDAGSVEDRSYLPLTAPITLTFNSTTNQFAVSGAVPVVSNIAYNPATASSKTISFNGLSFTISGTPQNNDSFTLSSNSGGVSDNRTMQLLGNLQNLSTLAGTPGSTTSGASASYQSAYSQIVSQVGNKTREVEVTGKAQQTQADQAQSAVDQISGVNLDEEAADLLRFQQAYQASAKLIDTAGKLFDEILALGR
ncbi:MAG: flagellar hook-associated protein FlgK [Sulfurisoma sp.]|nr:flagellar hook-associated protein FlgK [Sulfurisoma sp.]